MMVCYISRSGISHYRRGSAKPDGSISHQEVHKPEIRAWLALLD
jgi:hypothetical protein